MLAAQVPLSGSDCVGRREPAVLGARQPYMTMPHRAVRNMGRMPGSALLGDSPEPSP